ncbi:MAG: ethanolamine ammonia-lyase subunit EutC [Bryobacteraceae bacterium]
MNLRNFTPARVALGRTGHSLPTRELLDFQLAHARARDAVHAKLDTASLLLEGIPVVSAAADRITYLRRPDLGRKLNEDSRQRLQAQATGDFDAVFVIADGLSALAVHRHAKPLLDAVIPRLPGWRLAPIVIAEQARVALGDEIGQLLRARLAVVLVGERPGLTSPDSLGIYLTWDPKPGRTDAERNCISNIRVEGLSYTMAADQLIFLMTESRRRKLSGVHLKEAFTDSRLCAFIRGPD